MSSDTGKQSRKKLSFRVHETQYYVSPIILHSLNLDFYFYNYEIKDLTYVGQNINKSFRVLIVLEIKCFIYKNH
jgi:hypothetical protein